MAYYENTKCGHCGYSLSGGYVSSNGFLKTSLGVPYLKCENCGIVNKTKLAPYSVFHPIEKVYFWISVLIRNFIFFGIVTFVICLSLFKFSLIISLIFSIILSTFIAVYFGLRDIKIIEEEYNNMT